MKPITPLQSKEARLRLGWTMAYVAKISGIGQSTVYNWEAYTHGLGHRFRQILRATYESGGIIFDDFGGTEGMKESVFLSDFHGPAPMQDLFGGLA